MVAHIRRVAKKVLSKKVINLFQRTIAGNNPPVNEFFPIQNGNGSNFGREAFGELLAKHTGKQITKWVHYIQVYEDLLAPYKQQLENGAFNSDNPLRFLEIGVADGGSLEVWSKYFDHNCLIYGIDIDEACRNLEIPGVQIHIGSQIDEHFLQNVLTDLGNPNIIVDDGSHHADHLSETLRILWPKLQEGGIYIIEDTHTSYWQDHGGGYRKSATIIEFAKDAIDTMHQAYTRKRLAKRTAFLGNSLLSISFYDSIIVLRKQKTLAPKRVTFGSMQSK